MLIKSVSVSFSILKAFVGRRSALTLKEISFQAGLPASKAHRYLQSLIREGMVTQEPRTRLYRLGQTAISLGLEALENTDPVVNACETVRPLAEQYDVGASIDVLGPNGPICIWYEQPASPIRVPVRVGTSQPLLRSAAGQVFLAFVPRHVTRGAAVTEAEQLGDLGGDPDSLAHGVRKSGYAHVPGQPGATTCSVAAPVLDARGEACAAISFYLRECDRIEDREDRRVAALLTAANEASAFKHYRPSMRLAEAV